MQHPATSVALETDLTCTYAIIFLVSEGVPPVLLFGVQLERYLEVGSLTGKWDFPADVVVTIFVIIKDTCGVRVADRVVVCELLLVGEVPPLVLSGWGAKIRFERLAPLTHSSIVSSPCSTSSAYAKSIRRPFSREYSFTRSWRSLPRSMGMSTRICFQYVFSYLRVHVTEGDSESRHTWLGYSSDTIHARGKRRDSLTD